MTTELTRDDLLLAHAAGRLPAAIALAVDTHLALSGEARVRFATCLALGGVLLEEAEPEPLTPGAWERLERKLEREKALPGREPEPVDPRVPRPLRRLVPRGFDALPWRNLGPAQEVALPIGPPGYRARLLRLEAGRSVPRHTHEGHELTVVIEGGFTDVRGHHVRGDLVIADPSVEHRPVADRDGDCLCLVVTDAPLRLTGPIGRLLNPLLRI